MTASNETRGLPRGIEHIGITVPNHEEAVAFFKAAFGAEVLFSHTTKDQDPLPASQLHDQNGLRHGTAMIAVSMLRIANGPNLEIFEIDHPVKMPPGEIAAWGISHFSINTDDIDATCDRFAAAGGTLLQGPYDLGPPEKGPGNRGRFGQTPWGLLIEFEQLPGPMQYAPDATTTRWIPEKPEPRE